VPLIILGSVHQPPALTGEQLAEDNDAIIPEHGVNTGFHPRNVDPTMAVRAQDEPIVGFVRPTILLGDDVVVIHLGGMGGLSTTLGELTGKNVSKFSHIGCEKIKRVSVALPG
jgi:hypothetical protein